MKAPGSARWWALGALALSLLAIGLDLTVLNVALPTMAVQLHADTGALQWIVDAYTLVLAAVMLPAGMLGDRFGRKRMLVAALAVFGVASLACAYAPDTGALIAARAFLGLSAAFLMPMSLSVLTVLFPPEERPRAMTVWATASAIGIPLGPIVGGYLLNHFWWGSVFLINVPLAVIAVAAVAMLVPESRSGNRTPLDLVGSALSGIGLLALTFGLIRAGTDGWGDPTAVAMMAGGVVVLAGFVFWLRRTAHPLVDLGLFRYRGFTWGAVLATVVNFAMFGLLFALPQYFQAVNGTDALGTGLRLLPMIGGLLVGARVAGRLTTRLSARAILATGYVALAAGLGLGALTSTHSGFGFIATWEAILGAGMGFAMPTAMATATEPLSDERSGAGSALLSALRQVGGTIGVAILGTVLSDRYRAGLDLTGRPAPVAAAAHDSVNAGARVARATHDPGLLDMVRTAFTHGMTSTLWISCGIAAVAVVCAIAFLPGKFATMKGGVDIDADVRSERESRREVTT